MLGIPSKGDRVEMRHCGIRRAGTVWYADQLQVLVKWDDGGSSSLRRGSTQLRNPVAERPSRAAEEETKDARQARVSVAS